MSIPLPDRGCAHEEELRDVCLSSLEIEMKNSSNFMRVVLLICLLAGCKAASSADSADDTKKWQGTWKMVSCTYDGEPQMADMEWIVAGDRYTIRLNGVSNVDPYMFKLDAGRKRIDVFHHETPAGTYGGSLKGIYEVSGDSLTVCYDLTDQRYPESLDAKRGSRQVLYQFRRE
jgi:uncharacterized protein (TIGR03067 family)